jgi:hypothetical protein
MLAQIADKLRGVDADTALMGATAAAIEAAATRYPLDRGAVHQPGEPLQLLFAGYAGGRNTGADVRVEEMIRQVRHLVGDDHLRLSICTLDPAKTRGYFRNVRQIQLPDFFPPFLYQEIHRQHGVVACEGSMFKSRFANALSSFMVGALGVALAEHKPAIGYGGEAGGMDKGLEALVGRYVRGADLMMRNPESTRVLGELGIESAHGTDTAWTFEPCPPEAAHARLKAAGWNGTDPVLTLCPIHPFWWPVKPDVGRGLLWAATGAGASDRYRSFYFHKGGAKVDARFEAYLEAWISGVSRFLLGRRAFVAVVAMEALDRTAAERIAARLPGAVVFGSDEVDHRDLVGGPEGLAVDGHEPVPRGGVLDARGGPVGRGHDGRAPEEPVRRSGPARALPRGRRP